RAARRGFGRGAARAGRRRAAAGEGRRPKPGQSPSLLRSAPLSASVDQTPGPRTALVAVQKRPELVEDRGHASRLAAQLAEPPLPGVELPSRDEQLGVGD